MFKRFKIYIINHLGFSNSEANGFIVLLVITGLSVVTLRLVIPKLAPSSTERAMKDELALEQWHEQVQGALKEKQKMATSVPIKAEAVVNKFDFDPNLASTEDLVSIGFSHNIARRILNYRQSGGSFRIKSDLKKIYGIDKGLVEALYPWILLPVELSVSKEDIPPIPVVKTDLNKADETILREVRGVGPVLSSRIVRYRSLVGGFYDLNQLKEVYGLADSTVTEISGKFFIDTGGLSKIDINGADADALAAHPYLDYNISRVIVNYRLNHGKYRKLDDLKKIKIFSDSLATKIQPYLHFESEMP